MKSVDDYVQTYGFCNWQAQEVIKERDDLEAEVRSMQRRLSDQTRQLRELRDELAEHEASRADYIREAIHEVKDRVRAAINSALEN